MSGALALLVDAGGTLLHTTEPVAETYARVSAAHGHTVSAASVKAGFRAAFAERTLGPRYVGDGRPFWRRVVWQATGSADPALFEELYAHYTRPEAWLVAEGAAEVLDGLRAAGVRTAVASNWDSRLRPLLDALDLTRRIDAIVVSCEVGVDKPAPALFLAACAAVGVPPASAVHVGDDEEADVRGARRAGLGALHWGVDVRSFAEIAAWLRGAES